MRKIFISLILLFCLASGASAASVLDDSALIPATTTSPEVNASALPDLKLPAEFTRPGAETTDVTKITDPAKVSDFVLDVVGQGKVKFLDPINLAIADNIKVLSKIDQYIKFANFSVTIKPEIKDYFKAPLAITVYNIPFVADPIVLIDNKKVEDNEIVDFYRFREDGVDSLRFNTNKTGVFTFAPVLSLAINDGEETIKTDYKFFGRISDPLATLSYKLNNQLVNQEIVINQSTGEFDLVAPLIAGENTIEVSALSKLGLVDSVTKKVKLNSVPSPAVNKSSIVGPNPIILLIMGALIVVLILMWILKYLRK